MIIHAMAHVSITNVVYVGPFASDAAHARPGVGTMFIGALQFWGVQPSDGDASGGHASERAWQHRSNIWTDCQFALVRDGAMWWLLPMSDRGEPAMPIAIDAMQAYAILEYAPAAAQRAALDEVSS